jgi:glycosyltransferase involved in cell wall biosynthesis
MSGTFYKPAQFRSDWNYWSVAIKTRIEKYLFRKAKSIITLTEQGKQELLTYGINKPIAIIPNGVDVAEFDPDASADKTIDVIFTGRIEKRKGSDTLADVIRELIRIKPSIKICIVGDGPEAPKVKDELSALYENVQMTGKVPFHEVAALLQRSRIYASTSYYEGLPGTCLEAMAMGLPAITWDFGFYDDLVVNGETGFRIKPNDVSTFAFRACSLLDSPSLSRMSREARSVVLSGYDWQDLSRRVVDALTASAGIQPSRLTQSS